jgi:hypothetical protein
MVPQAADVEDEDELGPMFGQLAVLPDAPAWFMTRISIAFEWCA